MEYQVEYETEIIINYYQRFNEYIKRIQKYTKVEIIELSDESQGEVNKIIKSKYGKLLRIKSKDIEMADKWFDTKGRKTVFFCRFIPVVRSLISIPAGMSEMPLPQFTIYTFW